ncbi:MAG: histidinol-phosphate transaminase [Thermodesulfobacteriota bacterium]|nr:histidinol-phosphate transaminase [Thermodesulfobacteriota bacterium]
MDVTRIVKGEVLGQEAYQIDERVCRIKLDANENPYPLPEELSFRLFEYLRNFSLNRYPAPGSPELRLKFAEKFGIGEDMIIIGNGLDEMIQMLLTALPPSGSVLIPSPTFAMYKISSINTGHEVIEIPLDENFDLKTEEILRALSERSPSVVFLSYPNNPPGNCFDRKKMEKIIGESEGIVVVDEAYFHFSGATFLPLLERFDNLVILRTLSKVGLAAIRVGILVGHPPLIHELNKVRLPYNLNTLSQAAANFFIEHEDEFLTQIEKILAGRDRVFHELESIEGIKPYPTDSNFILFSCLRDKDGIYERLIEEDVLIKNFGSSGILKDCMRVTLGTDDENDQFLRALRKAVLQ